MEAFVVFVKVFGTCGDDGGGSDAEEETEEIG